MKVIFNVDGMHCDGCKRTIENELKNYNDIIEVLVSLETKQVEITCKDNIKIKAIEKRIKKAGFKPIKVVNIEE